MLIDMPEYSDQESPCCASGMWRPSGSKFYDPWFCMSCGTSYHTVRDTFQKAQKACLGCDATLELSDPDICVKCDEHGVIIVNGRAYEPVRN